MYCPLRTIKSFEFLLLQILRVRHLRRSQTIKSFEFLLLQIRNRRRRTARGGLLSLLNFYCCRCVFSDCLIQATIKSFEFLLLQIQREAFHVLFRLLSLLNFYCCRLHDAVNLRAVTIKSFEFLLLQIQPCCIQQFI